MHLHILGICGTFMGGVAVLARALGHRVSGSDERAYPPMSDALRAAGIAVEEGYDPVHLRTPPDCVIIGNALTRGNPSVEHVLNRGLPFTSGPQWLAEEVLRGRWVLAVSGTHGKTSTASMLAHILARAGRDPGFLVGGVPHDFGFSARLGAPDAPFVVEADEYDSALFDKRAKFVHYLPRTLIINNIEFDHADIYDDLNAIRRQFHHLVRTLPGKGLILRAHHDEQIDRVLGMGCWTATETFGLDAGDWSAGARADDGSAFDVRQDGVRMGRVEWPLIGRHNVMNALAAVAAAHHVGVGPGHAIVALSCFTGVKRRLELRGRVGDVSVYDDFAHHPSAIAATLGALRARVGGARILAVLDPASNTMRLGVHRDALAPAMREADLAWLYRRPGLEWRPAPPASEVGGRLRVADTTEAILDECVRCAAPGDHLLVMSNSAFEGLPERLVRALEESFGTRPPEADPGTGDRDSGGV